LDVLIIGAGWAGATAAKTLINAGRTNIKVLEARDYTGGRTHTVMESVWEGQEDYPVDIGSQWIHGITGNPISQIASAYGVSYRLTEYLQMIYNEGGPISSDEVSSLQGELYSGSDGFIPYQAVLQTTTEVDQSLQSAADQYVASKSDPLTLYKRNFLKFFMDNRIGHESAGSLDDLSLWWWNSEEVFGGVDGFPQRGFSELFNAHAQGAVQDVIETKSRVTTIDTTGELVKVVYTDTATNQSKEVMTHKVLVTVPLGVLKKQSIGFTPALPEKTLTAISSVGMGLLNKVVMFWKDNNDIFWPKSIEWLGAIATSNSIEIYNAYPVNGGKPVLVAFAYGNYAKELEDTFGTDTAAYQTEMTNQAMMVLRSMFGNSIPDPMLTKVTQWGKDDLAYGSYSFNKVGMSQKAREDMCTPLQNNRIFFAGEACNNDYFGTTHGEWPSLLKIYF